MLKLEDKLISNGPFIRPRVDHLSETCKISIPFRHHVYRKCMSQ